LDRVCDFEFCLQRGDKQGERCSGPPPAVNRQRQSHKQHAFVNRVNSPLFSLSANSLATNLSKEEAQATTKEVDFVSKYPQTIQISYKKQQTVAENNLQIKLFQAA